MGRGLCIDPVALERRSFRFDTSINPESVELADGWVVDGCVETRGVAELLDREGLRTIRVRGALSTKVERACDRCIDPCSREIDDRFELYFYPEGAIEEGGEHSIGDEETEVGFYEPSGLGLAQVMRDQLNASLPMRWLCKAECPGMCPVCGTNRNTAQCDCENEFEDPRWDALRRLATKR